jgi:hypothetical protein
MWTCRGISKSFLVVAPCRSFPSPVAAMVGSATLGFSRELRTRPIRNRPRTSRWGQVEHKPGATSSTSAEPPQRAHSLQATSCRNDGKYPAVFDTILADARITVVRSGVQMPRMNAIAERWVRTCRRELLNRTLIWNQRHLWYALREFETFYNEHRPHQGIANARPLKPLPEPITDPDKLARLNIHRCDRLGGVLHEYEHAA